jgi:hypothetical protein
MLRATIPNPPPLRLCNFERYPARRRARTSSGAERSLTGGLPGPPLASSTPRGPCQDRGRTMGRTGDALRRAHGRRLGPGRGWLRARARGLSMAHARAVPPWAWGARCALAWVMQIAPFYASRCTGSGSMGNAPLWARYRARLHGQGASARVALDHGPGRRASAWLRGAPGEGEGMAWHHGPGRARRGPTGPAWARARARARSWGGPGAGEASKPMRLVRGFMGHGRGQAHGPGRALHHGQGRAPGWRVAGPLASWRLDAKRPPGW